VASLIRRSLAMILLPVPRATRVSTSSSRALSEEPLCYAQIGGLAVATVITLLLVPVFYSIAVLDLKIIKWEH
jgi:multidrug efflux pump subunit AcrB